MGSEEHKEEPGKMVADVLSHCQVIYDAIQNLDKKFDAIHMKLSKRQHNRLSKKCHGYAYRCCAFPFFKRRTQKPKKKEEEKEAGQASFAKQQEPQALGVSPLPDLFTKACPQYFMEDALSAFSSASALAPPCFASPTERSIASIFSTGTAELPPNIMAAGVPASNAEVLNYNTPVDSGRSGSCFPSGFATSSPIENEPSVMKSAFADEPSGWSVEEVLLFLKQKDPHMMPSIADLFRKHEIDGKAMLLLSSDLLIRHLGLKLGVAVKLGHAIDKLKEEKCISI
ncbi:sex comb on midleg-like protein 1 [Ochotona princeps]|uniref:sex comb on midleg-like protein 1 n=1 Tax=Ochotona princeps TaxID=9978 RepID=UPI0027148180|nr:sex comb on midleg-like protein 1 [Ochotona princeps]